MVEVTKLPNSLPFVEGIINLRGNIIPLIDLRKRLGFPSKKYDSQTLFIVLTIEERLYGFIVDRVGRVTKIPKELVEPTPTFSLKVDTRYVQGIAKFENRLLIILSLEELFSNTEYESISNVVN